MRPDQYAGVEPDWFAIWADIVIPSATGILTLITAIVAVVIAANANKTAGHALRLEERLAVEAIDRDALQRRRELATAVLRWHEHALLRAIAGKNWNDAVGAERAERWKVLAGQYGNTEFEDYVHSLGADIIAIMNAVGLGGEPPPDALGRIGGAETEVGLWVADPAAFSAQERIRQRVQNLRDAIGRLQRKPE